MQQYYYKGIPVSKILGQEFEFLLNVKDGDGNIYTVTYQDLRVYDGKNSIPPQPAPTEEVPFQELPIIPLIEETIKEKKIKEVTPTKNKEAVKELEKIIKADAKSPATQKVFKVNEFSEKDISSLARELPGIGKVTLKKVLINRPKDGYESLEDLSFLNSEARVKWDHLEIDIIF